MFDKRKSCAAPSISTLPHLTPNCFRIWRFTSIHRPCTSQSLMDLTFWVFLTFDSYFLSRHQVLSYHKRVSCTAIWVGVLCSWSVVCTAFFMTVAALMCDDSTSDCKGRKAQLVSYSQRKYVSPPAMGILHVQHFHSQLKLLSCIYLSKTNIFLLAWPGLRFWCDGCPSDCFQLEWIHQSLVWVWSKPTLLTVLVYNSMHMYEIESNELTNTQKGQLSGCWRVDQGFLGLNVSFHLCNGICHGSMPDGYRSLVHALSCPSTFNLLDLQPLNQSQHKQGLTQTSQTSTKQLISRRTDSSHLYFDAVPSKQCIETLETRSCFHSCCTRGSPASFKLRLHLNLAVIQQKWLRWHLNTSVIKCEIAFNTEPASFTQWPPTS